MPNHCSNSLSVNGPSEKMVNFINFNANQMILQKEKIIKNNKIFDKTVLLSFYRMASTIPNFGEIGLWNKIIDYAKDYDIHYDFIPLEDIDQDDDDISVLSFNKSVPCITDNLYNEHIEKWGTKWDCYNIDTTINYNKENDDIDMFYTFDTAWSPPINWFKCIVEKYNTLEFTLVYYEPGCDFAGTMVGSLGEITSNVETTFQEYEWDNNNFDHYAEKIAEGIVDYFNALEDNESEDDEENNKVKINSMMEDLLDLDIYEIDELLELDNTFSKIIKDNDDIKNYLDSIICDSDVTINYAFERIKQFLDNI